MTFTPRRFGLLQGALRDIYELVARPARATRRSGALIEDRVARLNKLVLNGWDDRDEDGVIEWPGECAQLGTGPDGQPLGLRRAADGRARRSPARSGSLLDISDAGDGARVITTDREHDCVPGDLRGRAARRRSPNSVTFTLTPVDRHR